MDKEIRIFGVTDFQELKENSWSGAIARLDEIEENGKEEEFLSLVNELISGIRRRPGTLINDKIEITQVNDFIWFDDEWYFEELGMEWK